MYIKRRVMTAPNIPGELLPRRREAKAGIQTIAVALGNEVVKGLIDLWRGKLALVLEGGAFGLFFLVITFAQGKGDFHQVQVAPLLLGFVGYLFFHMQTNRLFWGLQGEIQSGTLEQMYLSPLPPWVLMLGFAVASVVEATLTAALLYFLINLVVPVTIPWRWVALLPLVLLVVGSVGYSLIVGGLTLRFKRLEILKELLQAVVFFFGGVLVSLERMPGWMATIARFLPLTGGIEGLRKTLLEGASVGALERSGTLWWLAGSALAYVVLGIVILGWCERSAKRRGTLGQY